MVMMRMIHFHTTSTTTAAKKSACLLTFLHYRGRKGSVSAGQAGKETDLCTCCFYSNRAGSMSGDSMCDLCSSHAEYINPETHRTLILCSPMRTKAGATCLQNKKNPLRPDMSLGGRQVKTTHRQLAVKCIVHSEA